MPRQYIPPVPEHRKTMCPPIHGMNKFLLPPVRKACEILFQDFRKLGTNQPGMADDALGFIFREILGEKIHRCTEGFIAVFHRQPGALRDMGFNGVFPGFARFGRGDAELQPAQLDQLTANIEAAPCKQVESDTVDPVGVAMSRPSPI